MLMKNNKATIIVLTITLSIVWGIVFYKIGKNIFSNEQIIQPLIKADKSVKNDTITIHMNYRDPFLDRPHKDNYASSDIDTIQAIIPPPEFLYKGRMKFKRSEKLIIEKKGEILYSKKDTIIDGYKVYRVTDDTLFITRGGALFKLGL